MRNLTVRGVPKGVAEALEREKQRRGTSLNRTVIDLLRQALGVGAPRSNGVAALAGTWTQDDLDEFEEAVASFDRVDADLWR
jgi:plasmid stability protein